jgi:hypothetical protein
MVLAQKTPEPCPPVTNGPSQAVHTAKAYRRPEVATAEPLPESGRGTAWGFFGEKSGVRIPDLVKGQCHLHHPG